MNKALLISTTLATIFATCCSVAGQADQPAVEPAARDYRIAIYNRFRLDRDQYNLHREAGDELLKAWRAAGSPEASGEEVVLWYQAAGLAALSSVSQPLPPTPHFEQAVASQPPPAPIGESYTPTIHAQTVKAPELTSSEVDAPANRSTNRLGSPSLDAPAPPDWQAPRCRILSSMAKAVLRGASMSN